MNIVAVALLEIYPWHTIQLKPEYIVVAKLAPLASRLSSVIKWTELSI